MTPSPHTIPVMHAQYLASEGRAAAYEGFDLIEHLLARLANPSPSVEGDSSASRINRRVIDANCPEDRSQRPRGFSLGCGL